MNTEYFIAKRIFTTKGKGKLSLPAVRVAVISIVLSIAVMIVSVAIVTGFQKVIRDKVIGFGAHIQINKYDDNVSLEETPIAKKQAFYPYFDTIKGIHHIQVYAKKAGIITTDEQTEGIEMKGIGSDYDWTFFKDRLVEGTIFKVNDSSVSKNIIISKVLAKRMKLKCGDSLRLWFLSNGHEQPKGRKLHISGIFETGLEEYDKKIVIVDIAQIQSLNKWTKNQVGGFEILLDDFNELDKMTEYVYANVGYDLDVKSIKKTAPQIFDWLELQDLNVYIILILMIIVAVINMVSTLLILILERTNMIGILKALGAKNISIRKIFLYVSAHLIGRGLLWGNIIAIGLCLIQKYTEVIPLSAESYYTSYVPINLNLIYILMLDAGTILVCMLILILPSLIISRIKPVKAIRFD